MEFLKFTNLLINYGIIIIQSFWLNQVEIIEKLYIIISICRYLMGENGRCLRKVIVVGKSWDRTENIAPGEKDER